MRVVASMLACAACFALGVGSKEHAVTLPAVLWLYEWLLLRRADAGFLRRSLPAMGLLALLGAGVATFLWDPFAGYAEKSFTLWERLLTQGRVLWFYLGLIAWPSPSRLSLMHSISTSTQLFAPWTTVLAWLSWAAVLGVAWHGRERRPWFAFALLWYLVTLSVESSILPLEMIYEHRTYLPLAGLCWCVAGLLARASWPRAGHIALAVSGVLALSMAAQQRNRVWLDTEALWRDAASKSGHERARVNLGSAILEADRYAEAAQYLEDIAREYPSNSDARRLLGAALANLERYDEAVRVYQEAVALEDSDHVSWAGIGSSYAMLGELEAAERYLLESVNRLADERFVVNLGQVYERKGEPARALERYDDAAWIAPSYEPAFRAMALLLLELGRPAEAIPVLERSIALDRKPGMMLRLALALAENDRFAEALRVAEAAARENPESSAALHTFARLLATAPPPQRDLRRALPVAERAGALAEGPARAMTRATLELIRAELAAGGGPHEERD